MSRSLTTRAALALLALLSIASAAAAAAESVTPRLDDQQFRALLQRVADGWNANDARKAADCFTEDAVYTEPPNKQEYRGRARLFQFFGGEQGRKSAMSMVWHHIAFDEQRQVGMGEFTFESGGKAHGVVVIRVREGLIANWREYYYESDLGWDEFTAKNPF